MTPDHLINSRAASSSQSSFDVRIGDVSLDKHAYQPGDTAVAYFEWSSASSTASGKALQAELKLLSGTPGIVCADPMTAVLGNPHHPVLMPLFVDVTCPLPRLEIIVTEYGHPAPVLMQLVHNASETSPIAQDESGLELASNWLTIFGATLLILAIGTWIGQRGRFRCAARNGKLNS